MGLFNFLKRKDNVAKVGDFIKCIDDRNWNSNQQSMKIQYGKTYKVLAVVKCPSCNTFSYDIGCRFDNPTTHTKCSIGMGKGEHELPFAGTHLAGIFRFEKTVADEASEKASKKEIEEKIKEAVESENYELADKLTKTLAK